MAMDKIKNKPIVVLVLVTLVTLGGISLLPIDKALESFGLPRFHAEYLSLTLKMGLIFVISYGLITKLNIQITSGLSRSYKWRFKYLNVIPFYLVILGALGAMELDFLQVHFLDVSLLLLACLTVGIAEEFLFRGFLQSMFLRRFADQENGRYSAVLFPAVIFGLFHLINLSKNTDVMAVIIQVIFAIFIGFYFGVLVLKTNKIIPVAITHGLINFSFSLIMLPGIAEAPQTEISLAPIIITIPLFVIGFLVLRNIRQENVVAKVNESFK